MLSVSAGELAENINRFLEAARREPVGVTTDCRVAGVLVSADTYEDYARLKRLATRSLRAENLSDESIAAIEASNMDPRHAVLDALVDDD